MRRACRGVCPASLEITNRAWHQAPPAIKASSGQEAVARVRQKIRPSYSERLSHTMPVEVTSMPPAGRLLPASPLCRASTIMTHARSNPGVIRSSVRHREPAMARQQSSSYPSAHDIAGIFGCRRNRASIAALPYCRRQNRAHWEIA